MSKHIRLCAFPIRTVLFRPVCSYCEKSYSNHAFCDYKFSILACDDQEHRDWADRDAKAWFHENGIVHMKHIEKEPLFQETNILSSVVKVIRSSGILEEEGWTIKKDCFSDPALIKVENGKWYIPVYKAYDEIIKCIPVRDLKMSLPEDKHYLVDSFHQKLELGFYSEESLRHNEARDAQKELEERQKEEGVVLDNKDPVYEIVFHPEYGYGRVV
jgi:hypothetical protein